LRSGAGSACGSTRGFSAAVVLRTSFEVSGLVDNLSKEERMKKDKEEKKKKKALQQLLVCPVKHFSVNP
jgi:hypothetical protein